MIEDPTMRYLLLLGASVLFMGMMSAAWMLLRDMQGQERYFMRLRQVHGEKRASMVRTEKAPFYETFSHTLSNIGQSILNSGLVPAATRGQLEAMLRGAGIRAEQSVGVFFGAKILMMIGMPIVTWLSIRNGSLPPLAITVVPFASGVIGLVLPDLIVKKMRSRYMSRLQKGLPDALDMMVICAQAGLGLGAAVIRVAEEMKVSYRDLAIEFSLTANELQIMSDTRMALHNLGQRTGLEEFRRLAMTLIQTIQYGTPLTDALRTLSSEMRQEALTKFEESAARLPTMLTMPMIIFILPCVFMIAGGPAIIQVMRAMG